MGGTGRQPGAVPPVPAEQRRVHLRGAGLPVGGRPGPAGGHRWPHVPLRLRRRRRRPHPGDGGGGPALPGPGGRAPVPYGEPGELLPAGGGTGD